MSDELHTEVPGETGKTGDCASRLLLVRKRIGEACLRVGRDPGEVSLIAVSKTKPVSMIEELYAAGQRLFGENRPQELRDKAAVLPGDILWHMIGHLQKNKIKYVVGTSALIHSVDSYELASAIHEEAAKRNTGPVSVLLEVNVAEEASKFGLHSEETIRLAKKISGLSNIRIQGLMTVAPFVEDPEQNRPVFRELRELSVDIASENIDNVHMSVLSMGMTNDFEVAVEEGASCVRVGTAIFGSRNMQVN
ncbi:MAG: YggS family pyridoxal phosphate-dependent enzyme [Eubacterium sp.]|nr:YggS family pyridoxal phosphate-dependent enzyme [Eubacterium sp.]